jgi:uncharacterized protein YdaT
MKKSTKAAGTVDVIERHVVKDGDHWNVEKPNAKRPSASVAAQQEAIERAKLIVSRAGGGHVIVHKKDGSVRGKITVKPVEK